ncbi:MAG: hypothetical protein LBB43_02880 [Spirochaetaceae bacterium]|jgi:hypothetical protein|nr:hypothetical protein [Spirochaetaceae bacterium]
MMVEEGVVRGVLEAFGETWKGKYPRYTVNYQLSTFWTNEAIYKILHLAIGNAVDKWKMPGD